MIGHSSDKRLRRLAVTGERLGLPEGCGGVVVAWVGPVQATSSQS